MWEIMEIGRSNIHLKDEPDQIRKGEGLAGDSDCHYILGLPIEHPMTQSSFPWWDTLHACVMTSSPGDGKALRGQQTWGSAIGLAPQSPGLLGGLRDGTGVS